MKPRLPSLSLLFGGRPLRRRMETAWAMVRPLLPPVLLLAAVLLGAVSGFLATKLPLEAVVLALAGLLVVIVALSRPELVILLMLITSSSIYDRRQIPTIHVGFGFTAIELTLIFLLGLVIAQSLERRRKPYIKTALDLPVALFFLSSFVSLLNAVLNLDTDIDLMEYQWRILFNYLSFFAVTNLVRDARQLRTLLVGMFIVAAVVAALMLVQQAVGTTVVILPGRVETAGVGESDFYGVTRILPPGQSLILVMLMPAIILLATHERLGRKRPLLLLVTVLLLIAQAFTFNRRMWVGTAIAIIVVFVLSTREQRKKLLTFFILFAIAGALVIPLVTMFVPLLGVIFNALYVRAASLFSGAEVEYSSSWQWRVMEIGYAKRVIRDHPLLGIGPGNDYRPRVRLNDRLTGYIHNGYYFVLTDMGLVGLGVLAWLSALFLKRGFTLWRAIPDDTFRAVALGLALSYVTVLITCVAAPAFMEWYWTPVLGVMFGINEVIYRLNGVGGEGRSVR